MRKKRSVIFASTLKRFVESAILQHPIVVLGSMVGAFGMLNVLDSIVVAHLGTPWSMIPAWMYQLLGVFRAVVKPMFDTLAHVLGITISPAWRDYFTMGIIVGSMRFRSTMHIRRAVLTDQLTRYDEPIFGRTITVTKASAIPAWFVFFCSRVSYATAFWPAKLFGAVYRYLTGQMRTGGAGAKKAQAQDQQYLVFFGAIIWFLFILLALAITRASR